MTQFTFTNFGNTTLASAAPSSATTLTLASATNFPSSIPAGYFLPLILNDASTRSIFEIVYATAISGVSVTVERAQEGTSAQNWSTGDIVYAGPTAAVFNNYQSVVGLVATRVANSYTLQSSDGGKLLLGSTTTAVSNFTLAPVLTTGSRIAIGQNAGYATNLIIPSGITVYGMGQQWTNTTITLPATTLGEEILVLSYTYANQFLIESVTPTTANALGITYAPGGVAGDARNLAINYASTTTLTITADEILAKSALGGIPFAIPSLNVTLNVGTTGLNGMDTGSPSASADLSVYAITGSGETPGVIACLGSVSNGTIYTGSHLPSGYTASALIGSYRMNSSAQFNSFNQSGNFILLGSQITVLSGGSAAGPTAISLSSATPANAKSVSGTLQIAATSASASLAIESVSGGAPTASLTGYSASNIADDFSDVPLITPQQFYYTYNGGGSGSIFISAYRI